MNAFLPPAATVADALRNLATWIDLPDHRQQKLRTALSKAARLLAPQMPPATAPAAVSVSCESLSRLLQAPAATWGLTPARMSSLCSELRYVLRRLGLHEPNTRGTDLRTAALQRCRDLLPPFRQLAVLDFLRFLDTETIAPQAVTSSTLDAYLSRCAANTLCADIPKRARLVAATWNWAGQNIAGWPGSPIIRATRKDQYSLRLHEYPLAFQADLDRYGAHLGSQDMVHIFATAVANETGVPRRRRKALRPASIRSRMWFLRCAAAGLVHMGHDPSEVLSLRSLVEPPAHPEAILRFFLARRHGQSSVMAARVAQTLYLLARDYCRLPDESLPRLADWAANLEIPDTGGITDKNKTRLRALLQPRAHAMLLCFPQELMRRAALPGVPPRKAALLAMHAVAMEILLICPMRRGNLVSLRLDQHLHQPDPRKRTYSHIFIGKTEVKNDNAIEWPIPLETNRLIGTYLRRYRPHLADPGNPFLFGIGDKQRDAQYLGQWLSNAVTESIGVAFNVHLVRHFAACNYLRQHPGQYELVRQVLGHKSVATTIKFYCGLETAAAAQQFNRSVLGERQAVRQFAAQSFRKGRSKRPRKPQRTGT